MFNGLKPDLKKQNNISSNKIFETIADKEAILPCESPGEDAAEQLEGVSGL